MTLKDCTFGRMVIDKDKRVGFVKRLTYNVQIRFIGDLTADQLFDRTIVVVDFPDGEQPIHPCHLQPFEN